MFEWVLDCPCWFQFVPARQSKFSAFGIILKHPRQCNIWELEYQKQLSGTWSRVYIPQILLGVITFPFSLPLIPASDTPILILVTTKHIWSTLVSRFPLKSHRLNNRLVPNDRLVPRNSDATRWPSHWLFGISSPGISSTCKCICPAWA